jgi:hypothetical protein
MSSDAAAQATAAANVSAKIESHIWIVPACFAPINLPQRVRGELVPGPRSSLKTQDIAGEFDAASPLAGFEVFRYSMN